ncbi:MAG: hypothetical protein BGP15_15320 [Sphingobacterium sp. 40-24]|nr:MAG: hypothetical protein BGP15_15320 [Sphingobacterium sp. 40-24]
MTKFPFVKGKEYTLTFPINLEGYDDKSFLEVSSKSYFPEIEIYTIKNLNGSGLFTQYINPPLKSTNDVFQKISIPGPQDINKHQSRTITLKFIPDACFQFIGFKFRSNVSKNTKIHLKTPTISAKSLMEFVAEPEQCIGTTQVVTYRTSSGYVINEPVNWYVKGDLEIIGSTNGANVTVKSKGTGIGTVGYYPCDSSLGSFEFNIKPPKEDFEISGKPIVRPLETLVYYLPADIGLSNITFQVGGATVLGTTENSVRIRVLNKAYDSLPIVSITATGNTKCGLFTKTLYPDVVEN